MASQPNEHKVNTLFGVFAAAVAVAMAALTPLLEDADPWVSLTILYGAIAVAVITLTLVLLELRRKGPSTVEPLTLQPPEAAAPALPPPTASPVVSPLATVLTSPTSNDRIFVDMDVPDFLTLFDGTTSLEGEERFEKYKNKWMIVAGEVHDIGKNVAGEYSVTIYFTTQSKRILVSLRFDRAWRERITILQPRSRVRARGQLDWMLDAMDISLKNCDLLPLIPETKQK